MKHRNSLSCTVRNLPPSPFVLTRFWFLTVSVLDCFCLLRRHRKRSNIWLHLSGQKKTKKTQYINKNICLNYEFFVFTFSECTWTNLDWIQPSFSCFGSFILKCVLFDKGMVSDLCKGCILSLSPISSYINKFLRMPWCTHNLAPVAGAQLSRKS